MTQVCSTTENIKHTRKYEQVLQTYKILNKNIHHNRDSKAIISNCYKPLTFSHSNSVYISVFLLYISPHSANLNTSRTTLTQLAIITITLQRIPAEEKKFYTITECKLAIKNTFIIGNPHCH